VVHPCVTQPNYTTYIPVETLRRRCNGTVTLDCKPGPSTVLTMDEEQCLAEYVLEMADRGFGLVSEDLMRTAFTIVERSGRPHPFRSGMAGRGWLEAFRPRNLSPYSSSPVLF
jgi:hypothetical protein